MRDDHRTLRGTCWFVVLFAILAMSGCASHCGILNYCDIPKQWPLSDTFSVRSLDSQLCVGGARRSSCASKGVYQSGTRQVDVYRLSDEDDETEHHFLATLQVTGAAGDQMTVSCFRYNGKRVLGLTEVLVGVEVRDRFGLVIAKDPKHSVVRREPNFFGC